MRHDDRGISALDLLTVLLVVGALVSITVPVFMSSNERVKAAVCASNRASLDRSAASYQKLKGIYPTTLAQLVDKAYLAVLPACPSHGVYVLNSVATGGDGEVYCSVHYAGKLGGTSKDPALASSGGVTSAR
jgi:competence protein ComGC